MGFQALSPVPRRFLRCFFCFVFAVCPQNFRYPFARPFCFYTVLNNAPFFKNLPLYIARQRPSARFRRAKKPDRKALSLSFCLFSIPYSSF
jgi:hypothetical protein